VSRDLNFAARVVAWQQLHGRNQLPWQHPASPYGVWVSEIMLQQTQVATVIPYFQRFMAAFPDVPTLARAPLDAVLGLWAGLGYYARARHLHAAAQQLTALGQEQPPSATEALLALPGIGRSTAAAIRSLGHGEPAAILDGNVRRLLARHAGIAGWPGSALVQKRLWAEAETRVTEVTPQHARRYTQGLMDLGASVCLPRQPQCERCPLAADCQARLQGRSGEIPAPRPPRSLRREHRLWLLPHAGDRLLLQQRPPTGLWGGLWSPIEAEDWSGLERAAAKLGLALPDANHADLQRLPPLRHRFTHFELVAEPWLWHMDVVPAAGAVRADDVWAWHALTELPPLPRPVARLLAPLALAPQLSLS